jgi:hypothetical protein
MRMKIFHFDEIYIKRRRKRLSFPDSQCPKILLNSSISRSSRNEPRRLYTNTKFKNSRPKNIKNHSISLLQMQRCTQSNAKKEIKSFISKIMGKAIAKNFETKATQTKISLLK